MGNRILKDSICMSAEIDALSWFEEVVFYRLIVTVDDRGIYPADPVVLAHILFPRKEHITRKMMTDALDSLEQNRLIRRYHVSEKGDFLMLVSWNRHQRLRNSRPKYPSPEEATETETDFNLQTDVTDEVKTPGEREESEAPEPTIIEIPLNDGSEYGVTQKEADEYAALYPAVDVLQELRSMRGWCLSNGGKKKTRSGVRRFINSWLARAQDRGGASYRSPPGMTETYRVNPYQMMACEGEVI